MHQYIREQADALAQKRLEEYQHLWEWEGHEIPEQVPPTRDLSLGGGQVKEGQYLVKGPLTRKPRSRKDQLSQE